VKKEDLYKEPPTVKPNAEGQSNNESINKSNKDV